MSLVTNGAEGNKLDICKTMRNQRRDAVGVAIPASSEGMAGVEKEASEEPGEVPCFFR